MPAYISSRLIASTEAPFLLKEDQRTVAVGFRDQAAAGLVISATGKKLSLHLEHMTGNDLLPVLDIYLNLEDEHLPAEEHYMASMALYGLGESSTPSKGHDGQGQDRVFDAEAVFKRISRHASWSEKQFWLTFMPGGPLPADAVLKIGRIALYLNEY